ncbi:SET domain-containing protein, partial [Gymnopus androsaceus JB14]
DASIFSVQDLPGRGKGVIALRDIKRGELVIRESPLFILPLQVTSSPTALISHHLQQLTSYQYSQFYNLSYVNFHSHLDPTQNLLELALAIFQTNAVAAGERVGIFPRMARLNHGCSSAFNVVYTWREREGVLVVHALQDIKKGQELLTTYTDTKRSRDQRRAYLEHQYSFHCSCDVCSLPDQQSLESDQRLIAMSELQAQFVTWGSGAIQGDEAISLVKRIWDLGTEEGYTSERGRLASDAAWVAAAHADTKAWARLAEEWFGYEVGVDSEQVQDMRTLQSKPEGHPAWASRQPMQVSPPGP